MKNKIMGLIFQKGIVLFNITILVNVIMIYAAKAYIEPSIKYTFQYILNNISTESSAQEILNHYGTGDKILEPVAVVITIFRSFLLLHIYIYIITSASALIAFRSSFRINSFFLRKQNYNLQKNTSFFYEIKLISTWVALYSLCNFAMQGLGLSDFWYKKLAILSQALMFYLLFINSPISCTITQTSKELPKIIFEFDTQNSIHQNIIPKFSARTSQLSDIDAMVSLSKAKRLSYEKAQPQFWRYAGEEGDKAQEKWFKELLEDKNYAMFTAESETQEILGFVIGKLMPAPEVYNPGGLTLMIDDFCVQSENLWQSVGAQLIEKIKAAAKVKGVTQILVVCGAHDLPKRKFLSEQNLSIASEWFVGGIV